MKLLHESSDYSHLDDPGLLDIERRRVWERLERLPEHHGDRATHTEVYPAMAHEFDRRSKDGADEDHAGDETADTHALTTDRYVEIGLDK